MSVTAASSLDDILAVGLAILNFTADNPGIVGRVRAARILSGGVNEEDLDRGLDFERTQIIDLPATTILELIDKLIDEGQIVKTYGDRPRIALTRKGFGILAAIGASR